MPSVAVRKNSIAAETLPKQVFIVISAKVPEGNDFASRTEPPVRESLQRVVTIVFESTETITFSFGGTSTRGARAGLICFGMTWRISRCPQQVNVTEVVAVCESAGVACCECITSRRPAENAADYTRTCWAVPSARASSFERIAIPGWFFARFVPAAAAQTFMVKVSAVLNAIQVRAGRPALFTNCLPNALNLRVQLDGDVIPLAAFMGGVQLLSEFAVLP